MLFAQLGHGNMGNKPIQGHVGDSSLSENLHACARKVEYIQADGHELTRCCEILGRPLPTSLVYKFFGDNAKEIAANWF
jgi:hypothetical protein